MLELDGQALALAALGFAALATPWLATKRRRSRPRRDEASHRQDRIAAIRARRPPGPAASVQPPRPTPASARPAAKPPQATDKQPRSAPAPRPTLVPASARISAATTTPQPTPPPFSGRAWVVDGDTIVVDKRRIRLFGMDAPEMDQRGGTRAKTALIRLCRRERVTVEPLTFDCYERIVAKVWLADIDLSERMVRDGFAVANSRWHRDYLPAEREARAKRRGLWEDCSETGITDPAAHRAEKRREAERHAADDEPSDDSPAPPRRPWLA